MFSTMVEFQHNTPNSQRLYTEADFDGSRPTPFLLIGEGANPRIIDQQDRLIKNMDGVTRQQLEGLVTDDVVDFVANGIISRMHMREALNSHSYSNRLHKLPLPWLVKDHPWLETIDASRATIQGALTIAQSDMAQRAFGMQSIEYRNLTMFGEFRRDLEEPMWNEMSEFLGADARPTAQDVYRTKLIGFRGDLMKDKEIGAMRIELKSHIPNGDRGNGTIVKGRSTASVNTAFNSAFDQDVIESLREQKFESERDNKKVDLSDNPEFLACVGYLIDNELPTGLVLARNETVFGGNSAIEAQIRERNERRDRRKALIRGKRRPFAA